MLRSRSRKHGILPRGFAIVFGSGKMIWLSERHWIAFALGAKRSDGHQNGALVSVEGL